MAPTIRKFPRTLHEAFPFGPSYGAAIERPVDHADRIVLAGCVGAALCLVILAVAGVLA